MEVSLVEITKLASVGLISGLFSSFLAYRAHRQKKWWELRVSAYQDLIDSLSDLSIYYGEHYRSHLLRYDISEERQKRLGEIWEQSHQNVRRSADKGAFIFSKKVGEALKEYIVCDDARADDYYDHIEIHEHQIKKCLSIVVEASKQDLKTKWWWL